MDIYNEFLQLARLSISGRREDVITLLRRTTRRSTNERPEFGAQLKEVLSHLEESFLRKATTPNSNNVGASDMFLKQKNFEFNFDPIWIDSVRIPLEEIIQEQKNANLLKSVNVLPTRSVLFIGPPGVGKTLAAHWLEKQLGRNLFTLNLASIMSSYLGRTGANLSMVLDDAANEDSILFLDEFDSIGKTRGDIGDVGELKRLVNVLLQSLDNWPRTGLLVAATNHPELLDKAVWRRFDRVIDFTLPTASEQTMFTHKKLTCSSFEIDPELMKLIGAAFENSSFADSELWLNSCIRKSVLQNIDLQITLQEAISDIFSKKQPKEKSMAAMILINQGISQRKASELLQVSRDTIRKYMKNTEPHKDE